MVTEFSYHLLGLYRHYDNGILPFKGGLYDQPRIFGEAMNIIASEINSAGGK